MCCGLFLRDNIDVDIFLYLKRCYIIIFDGFDECFIIINFWWYVCCRFNGDFFGLYMLRGDRLVFVLVRWCKFGGIIDIFGFDLRLGVIDYFM